MERLTILRLLSAGALALFFILSITLGSYKVPAHHGKCYDADHSEIIGQTCLIEEGFDFNALGVLFMSLTILFAVITAISQLYDRGII